MILAIGNGTTFHTLTSIGLETGKATALVQEHWTPTPPKITAQEIESIARDGGELAQLSRANVYERAAVVVLGTEAQIRTYIRSIETALGEAAYHATTGFGVPWYVYYDPKETTTTNAYRSQILYGTVTVESIDVTNGVAVIDVGWQRRFYWEGALTTLALTNMHADGELGRIVWNTDDASHDDWVAISGAAVLGSLPTPIRVEYTNRYDGAAMNGIHTALAVWGGLDQASANITFASARQNDTSWSGSAETRIAWWELTPAMMDTFRGQYYRMLLQCAGYPSNNVWARLKIMMSGDYPLVTAYEGDRVLLNGSRYGHDLGILQLPPWLEGQTGLQSVALALFVQVDGVGPHYLTGSYLKALPAATFRKIEAYAYQFYYNTRLVDDQITPTVYHDDTTGALKTGNYHAWGGTQYLWPGKDAVFYVKAWSGGSYSANYTGEVTIKYRPRRLSV